MSDPLRAYEEQGYVILPDLLSTTEVQSLRDALEHYVRTGPPGRNVFEGTFSRRIYSLVGRGEVFERTVEHPKILELVNRLLAENYLLTASQAICLMPGETPQPVHFDDSFYPIPRPRKPISVSTIWALDEFTSENGGTQVIPGSHTWDDARVADVYRGDQTVELDPRLAEQLVTVEMPAGSCVLFAGTLLHRGGANRSAGPRWAFSHQYCEPWARQQENYFLSIPQDRVARMSPRLRALLGYSIHPPFMGQVAGRHPKKTLKPGYRNSLEVDDDEV